MKRPTSVTGSVILIAAIAVACLFASGLLFKDAIERNAAFLQGLAGVTAVVGVAAIIATVAQVNVAEGARHRNYNLEQVRIASEFMRQFYASELDDIRRQLRSSSPIPVGVSREDISNDLVRLMNILEAVAIAVDRRLLDIELVDRMLQKPIHDIYRHKEVYGLFEDATEFSYEGVTEILVPRLAKLRGWGCGVAG